MTPRSSSLTWARASGGYMSDWTVKKGVLGVLGRGGSGTIFFMTDLTGSLMGSAISSFSRDKGGSSTRGEKPVNP